MIIAHSPNASRLAHCVHYIMYLQGLVSAFTFLTDVLSLTNKFLRCQKAGWLLNQSAIYMYILFNYIPLSYSGKSFLENLTAPIA